MAIQRCPFRKVSGCFLIAIESGIQFSNVRSFADGTNVCCQESDSQSRFYAMNLADALKTWLLLQNYSVPICCFRVFFFDGTVTGSLLLRKNRFSSPLRALFQSDTDVNFVTFQNCLNLFKYPWSRYVPGEQFSPTDSTIYPGIVVTRQVSSICP
jgi:hypothetical protein